MQRSSAPKLCSGPPAASGVSPWHTLEAPHNVQLTIPTLAPTPVSTGCCCVLTPPGPPSPPWAQHQGLPALKDSSQLHISHQHLWLPPASDWAPPLSSLATSHSSNPLCWYQFGGWFAGCAGSLLTLRNQLSFLGKWHQNTDHKLIPQVLVSVLGGLQSLVKWLKPFPPQAPTGLWQRLSAVAEASASSSQERTFHCLGDPTVLVSHRQRAAPALPRGPTLSTIQTFSSNPEKRLQAPVFHTRS